MYANVLYSLITIAIYFSMMLTWITGYFGSNDGEIVKQKQSLANGKNMAFNICGQCHYDEKTRKFSGREIYDLPQIVGKIYSANLTHSKIFGILSLYTDAQLATLVKTGISKDGRYLAYMLHPNIAEADLADIILFFRSNDKTLEASDTLQGRTKLNIVGKAGSAITAKHVDYKKDLKKSDSNDLVATGRYLVDNLACYHCHSESILGLNYLEPEKSKKYLQGGLKFKMKDGSKLYSANLTPDKETGIGNYTKETFNRALVQGISASGERLHPPMRRFSHLTSKQSDAIFAYLQSLKPVRHKIKKEKNHNHDL